MKERSCAVILGMFLAVSQLWSAEMNAEPTLTSIVRVLATPDTFNGKLVRLAGYCHLEFESDALYLHREDYIFRLPVNAVKLDLGDRNRDAFPGVSGHYTLVEGTFLAKAADDPRPYGGVVRVRSIEVLPPR